MIEMSEISSKQAVEFLLPKHYLGRKPCISKAFGLFQDDILVAVCTFGKPASNSLCVGICGKDYSENVYELNRLCRVDDLKIQLSQFVGYCLRQLKPLNWIIVSYSDTAMNHNGYIYQACNFIYTGQTKQRTDKWTEGNKHSRHYSNDKQGEYRKVRSAKNRYVYFCTSNRNLLKLWKENLNYKELPYPKKENKNYVLGEFQEPQLVKTNKKSIL